MKNTVYIRKPYERQRSTLKNDKPSVTDQSFGNDTDINNIIAKFSRTGEMPPTTKPAGQYADVTGLQADLTQLIEDSSAAILQLEKEKREQEQYLKSENANKIKAMEDKIAELQSQATNADNQPVAPPTD
mgnify:CR=1 FL=1